MRPIFTLHAGEYLVGSYLEQHYPDLAIWLPGKDTGVDLLVTDRGARRTLSLQVKFSKDFLVTHMAPGFRAKLRACGWWTFNRDKLRASPANYWVLVLQGFNAQSTDFVVIRPADLLKRLDAVHGTKAKVIQSYIWVSNTDACWETRGLGKADRVAVADGAFSHADRGLTKYLNNWAPVERLCRPQRG